ncbi:Uncharacterized protein SCF082_LOCUS49710 [Durusdinium trenchii]|uniref:Uncharacterized protein n=1 Tax=Durusdinium trenchii TaxID=1381693 RepID=A0ABP0S315_9DINO
MQVGKTAPREKGSDEKLVEVFGRQIGSWADQRADILTQLLRLLQPLPGTEEAAPERVFFCATALGKTKVRSKLSTLDAKKAGDRGDDGSWRWDSEISFEYAVGDAMPSESMVLMRVGWLGRGIVYRERGHDEWGFDRVRIALRTQSVLQETYVFSINLETNFFDA